MEPPNKRRKTISDQDHEMDDQDLLPGLPDHLAQVCLSAANQPYKIFSVCKSWRRLIYTPSFPPFLSLYALLSNPNQTQSPPSIHCHAYDPLSSTWHSLPDPPSPPRILLRHPSFVSRNLPIRSVSVAGKLIILAGTTENLAPAISRPLIFDPKIAAWQRGPEISSPRRWCCSAAFSGEVYVAGGVSGGQFSHETARRVERWRIGGDGWERIGDLKDARFSREQAEAVGWRGRLCLVGVRGGAAMDGAVFEASSGEWEDMPPGMLAGWRGPAAAMDEQHLFVVDEIAGILLRYDESRDCWDEILRSEILKGAEQIAAGGGRVCVVRGGGKGIAVVDVTSPSNAMEARVRVWEVGTPIGLEAVAVHVLPRMSME